MEAKDLFNSTIIIECHVAHSLWLFFMEESVQRFALKFHLGTLDFGTSYSLPLLFHDKKESLMDNVIVKNPSQLVVIPISKSCSGVSSLEEIESSAGNTTFSFEGSFDDDATVSLWFWKQAYHGKEDFCPFVYHIVFVRVLLCEIEQDFGWLLRSHTSTLAKKDQKCTQLGLINHRKRMASAICMDYCMNQRS